MGKIQQPNPVLLVISILSRYPEAISWTKNETTSLWGEIGLQSQPFSFEETVYYEPSMGSNLSLVIISFSELIHPADLVEIKHKTNALELDLAKQNGYPEKRPLNLDPGYITPAKFVLATTKNAAHRLYLGKGIFGEITLKYTQKNWQDQDWTYPNYRRKDYKKFLLDCRNLVMNKHHSKNLDLS